jgi:DNA-binding transcriptional MerR regulator
MAPSHRSEAKRTMYSIGEFSKVTGLTVKTLRFYHQEGLLEPSCVDDQTGYRYYDERQIEAARCIAFLRGWELSLEQIREILAQRDDDAALAILERHKGSLAERIKQSRRVARSIDQFIRHEREASAMTKGPFHVEEKEIEPFLAGAIRMTGRYSDSGRAFGRLARQLRSALCGHPLMLHYDDDYRDTDANFEVCLPVRRKLTVEEVEVRELSGGHCVALVHEGPYDQLGHSYAKILRYVKEKGFRVIIPTREVYLKGPGMILRGNPKQYLTEIQLLVDQFAQPDPNG